MPRYFNCSNVTSTMSFIFVYAFQINTFDLLSRLLSYCCKFSSPFFSPASLLFPILNHPPPCQLIIPCHLNSHTLIISHFLHPLINSLHLLSFHPLVLIKPQRTLLPPRLAPYPVRPSSPLLSLALPSPIDVIHSKTFQVTYCIPCSL